MSSFIAFLGDAWNVAATVLTVLLAVIASGHAVLYKRDSRAAVAWVGLIWLVPVVGPVLYVLLGINRIRRHAAERRAQIRPVASAESEAGRSIEEPVLPGDTPPNLSALAGLVGRVTGRPLVPGNAVVPLENGDEAYPAMLRAVEAAERSLALSTYIFDNDDAGRLFVAALAQAVQRGVAVRVLIDAVGSRYSRPSIVAALRQHGVPVALYGQTLLPWRMPYMNLRYHRKILVVDGTVGFTGGMNIRESCVLLRPSPHAVRDLHFRLTGPVVAQLLQTFADDWAFTTGEQLAGSPWHAPGTPAGDVAARGVSDGPDEDLDKARFAFLGALACARTSVRIATPYFLPDAGLITALDVAALRGVRVDIVLPERNNLVFVKWASTAQLWQVLSRGCRVFYTPGPFDHSKLMLVDGGWVLFGSTNWDPRSLRLNFEFGVECYDQALAVRLGQLLDRRIATAREVTLAEVDGRALPIRLRDGLARLAAPYL